MNRKLVSVIINTRNGHRTINKSIESVINQTYTNLELIVYDNMSTPEIKKTITKIDTPVKIIRQDKDLTLGQARNEALKHISGEYVTFLDDDDYMLPEKLERCVNKMEEQQNVGMIYTNAYIYYENIKKVSLRHSKKMPSGNLFNELIKKNFILWTTNFFNKNALLSRENPFDTRFNIVADYELYLFITNSGYKICYLDKILAIYRLHDNNYSRKYDYAIKNELNMMAKNYKLVEKQKKCLDNSALAAEAMSLWRSGCNNASRNVLKKLISTNKWHKAAAIYILSYLVSYDFFKQLFNKKGKNYFANIKNYICN